MREGTETITAESEVSMILQVDTTEVSTRKNAFLFQSRPDGHHRTLTSQVRMPQELGGLNAENPVGDYTPGGQVCTVGLARVYNGSSS